jgi:hypothetical protein
MNRFDDNNLTLPVTKGERKHKRGVSMGGSMEMLSQTQLQRRQAVSSSDLLHKLTTETTQVDPQAGPRPHGRVERAECRLWSDNRLWTTTTVSQRAKGQHAGKPTDELRPSAASELRTQHPRSVSCMT